MSREKLLRKLNKYQPADAIEEKAVNDTIAFVESNPDCFSRNCPGGHITGSAWVENLDGTKFLLTNHKKLKLWLQLGGHPEVGENDITQITLREAKEESGLRNLVCLNAGDIFDVSVFWFTIGPEKPHYHFDISLLLKAVDPQEKLNMSDESIDLNWFSQLPEYKDPEGVYNIVRMFNKWQRLHKRL